MFRRGLRGQFAGGLRRVREPRRRPAHLVHVAPSTRTSSRSSEAIRHLLIPIRYITTLCLLKGLNCIEGASLSRRKNWFSRGPGNQWTAATRWRAAGSLSATLVCLAVGAAVPRAGSLRRAGRPARRLRPSLVLAAQRRSDRTPSHGIPMLAATVATRHVVRRARRRRHVRGERRSSRRRCRPHRQSPRAVGLPCSCRECRRGHRHSRCDGLCRSDRLGSDGSGGQWVASSPDRSDSTSGRDGSGFGWPRRPNSLVRPTARAGFTSPPDAGQLLTPTRRGGRQPRGTTGRPRDSRGCCRSGSGR